MKKIINTSKSPAPIGPYNQAILRDNMLFISGQIALDPISMKLNNNSIENETNQVMMNLKYILEEANMDFSNVVKTTIFLKDMNDFSIVINIYQKTFENEPPARETVEVSRLPKDVNIEISVIASF